MKRSGRALACACERILLNSLAGSADPGITTEPPPRSFNSQKVWAAPERVQAPGEYESGDFSDARKPRRWKATAERQSVTQTLLADPSQVLERASDEAR
jgi:hypothetical protein